MHAWHRAWYYNNISHWWVWFWVLTLTHYLAGLPTGWLGTLAGMGITEVDTQWGSPKLALKQSTNAVDVWPCLTSLWIMFFRHRCFRKSLCHFTATHSRAGESKRIWRYVNPMPLSFRRTMCDRTATKQMCSTWAAMGSCPPKFLAVHPLPKVKSKAMFLQF